MTATRSRGDRVATSTAPLFVLLVFGGRSWGVVRRGIEESSSKGAMLYACNKARLERLTFQWAATVLDMHECRVDVVINGGAPGADDLGERWANYRGKDWETYEADWNAHRDAAGPIRNRVMLQRMMVLRARGHRVEALMMPGGQGTKDMVALLTAGEFVIHGLDSLPLCECHPRPARPR